MEPTIRLERTTCSLRDGSEDEENQCDQALLVDWDWRDCDDSMKFRLSSSGCEFRPARGEPARAGSEPGDGFGNGIGEA